MKKTLFTIIISTFISANEQIPGPPQSHPILLKNGVIHTISNGVIQGSILFDNGKITHVGEFIAPEVGTEVIDLEGKHVYPGFIAAVSGIGLVEINAVDVTNDHSERVVGIISESGL